MKNINVLPVPYLPRRSLLVWLLYWIAGMLARINRNHNDYDIREWMGELTPAELKADKARDVANEKYHDMLHKFWTSG